MVVADGMGGHNAGEVASQIAVETVRDMFSADKISDKQFDTPKSRANYLEDIVVAADKNIRKDAGANPERQGMGSTIVMVWIVGNELTVTWCGDSRAYRYRPGGKLEMLSEDHSLVQDMVRQKRISYEDTFSHPQGNVITRCLGGGSKSNAEPESRQFTLEVGDIVMLCSDGLSGVVFDYDKEKADGEPYSAENLQDILSRPKESLKDTISCLFDAARRCDWYDNVTAILFELKEWEETECVADSSDTPNVGDEKERGKDSLQKDHKKKCSHIWFFIIGFVLICAGFFLSFLIRPNNSKVDEPDSIAQTDSMQNFEGECSSTDEGQTNVIASEAEKKVTQSKGKNTATKNPEESATESEDTSDLTKTS